MADSGNGLPTAHGNAVAAAIAANDGTYGDMLVASDNGGAVALGSAANPPQPLALQHHSYPQPQPQPQLQQQQQQQQQQSPVGDINRAPSFSTAAVTSAADETAVLLQQNLERLLSEEQSPYSFVKEGVFNAVPGVVDGLDGMQQVTLHTSP